MNLTLDDFIAKWAASGGSERANYALFLSELCEVLDLPRPDATHVDDARNDYVFERSVTFHHAGGTTSPGRIDLYKRDCFVLEAKQGSGVATATGVAIQTEAPPTLTPPESDAKKKKAGTAKRGTAGWDFAIHAAFGQAQAYARALPKDHGYPPFLIVVDVGHTIDLHQDFARTGKFWTHFPDSPSFRIRLEDLREEKVRARLKAVFTDPLSLDPSRYAAAVTRELAAKLADLAKSLEAAGHNAEVVAQFLMRCLFTLFAEDIGLLPEDAFLTALRKLQAHPSKFAAALEQLWRDMNTGSEFSWALESKVLKFNGGLFAQSTALPLTADQIGLLIRAAKADWTNVEPAIFGTLLERALDPIERHRLGAHYTPRAYVERLVLPTVIEPLREDWEAVSTAAFIADNRGETKVAIELVRDFHRKLCETRVLDPACGTGNFLYVTLEHMKRLEGDVLQLLLGFGEKTGFLELTDVTVDPHQFLGIEVNIRAAKIETLARTAFSRSGTQVRDGGYARPRCRGSLAARSGDRAGLHRRAG